MAPLKFSMEPLKFSVPSKPAVINNALITINPLYIPPQLPDDIIIQIISHADLHELHVLTQVNRRFRKLAYTFLSTYIVNRIPYNLALHLLNNQHPDESWYDHELDSMVYPRVIYDVKPSHEQTTNAKEFEVITTRQIKLEAIAKANSHNNNNNNNAIGVFRRPPPKAFPEEEEEEEKKNLLQEKVYAPYFTLTHLNPMLALDESFKQAVYEFIDREDKKGLLDKGLLRTGNFSIDLLRMDRIVTIRDRERMKEMRRDHKKRTEGIGKGMRVTKEWKLYGAQDVEKAIMKETEVEKRKHMRKRKLDGGGGKKEGG